VFKAAVNPQMRLFSTIVAAIPAAIHLNGFDAVLRVALMTRESRRWLQIIEKRQHQLAFVMQQMTIVTQQNQVFDLVFAALAAHLQMMIFKTAMIMRLTFRRAPAHATTQTVAQVDLKTRSVLDAHFINHR